uniref:hypothetical protein n=1 Tax=Paractinoplanes polyasparticus TaxID=2856853 RepID=UPI001C85CDC2|nr:hypothetical protein [Actinoplanes polyasparticus]
MEPFDDWPPNGGMRTAECAIPNALIKERYSSCVDLPAQYQRRSTIVGGGVHRKANIDSETTEVDACTDARGLSG